MNIRTRTEDSKAGIQPIASALANAGGIFAKRLLTEIFLTAFFLTAINSASSVSIGQQDSPDYLRQVKPFLKTNCFSCHGSQRQESGVRLDRYTEYRPEDGALWTKVHEVLSSNEMPPEDARQPEIAEVKKVLSWIVKRQRAIRRASTRRLNRRELSAALQDLTGLTVDYASMLPADGKVDGFDTGADGLQDAADSVARILTVTRRAVNAIRFLEPAGMKLTADFRKEKNVKQDVDQWFKKHGYRVKPKGFDLKTKGVLLSPTWLGSRDQTSIEIPVEGQRPTGIARVQLVVSAAGGPEGMPAPHLNMAVRGQEPGFYDVTGTMENPQVLTFDIQLDELPIQKNKIRFGFKCLVELPYEVKGFPNDTRTKPGEPIPPGTGIYKPVFDRKKIRDPLEHPVPYTLLQQMTFEPDYVAAWPPESWQVEIGELTDSLSCAEKLLRVWMERAWRRPVEDAEIQHFLRLYEKLRSQEMSFDDALRATFQSVLMSGPFRYLASPSDKNPIDAQYAMASRLSFMLTGAPPDNTLRSLAAVGKLKDPKTIEAQIDRLVDDSSSYSFFEPFVTQWLEIGQPITIAMRSIKNQDFKFGRHLRSSMRRESVAYVRQMIIDNRPAKELVDSDWTMMNDILSRYYGHQPLKGSHLRKVSLDKDDPRGGGLLGQGGIQSMLTWMGDNWVIYRGAWTMRHILDDPPPPPPLEVPELDHSEGSNRGKTFRQLLRQHQEDKSCAVCHRKMDPIGFAFQNFDLSGKWRDKEFEQYVRNELDGKVEWYGKGKSRPIDASGVLPRGEKFESFSDFKNRLAQHYVRDMMRGLMKNFVLYGTGRKPDIDDLTEIDRILDEHSKNGFRMRDTFKALVKSKVFLD